MKNIFLASVLLVTVLTTAAWGDLSGRWSGNDGGIYYLRQTDGYVYWYGEAADAQPKWSNVFSGRLFGTRIKGNWADVPKGRTTGAGNLELVLENDGNDLRVVNKTGGFVATRWTRTNTEASVTQPLMQMKPTGKADCVRFDPAALCVRQVNGRWKIVDAEHWLLDFGPNQAAADQSLKVIRHYRMDRACFVGRPNPLFSYMLAKGGSPSGAIAGEDCVDFDPKTVAVSNIQGRWKIVSGRRWLFDFGPAQTEARQALSVIRRYRFSRSCFVGRPDADFSYLRR
ncbi:hypothetical protein [Desulfosarcina sp.]|uniref:hypothetical protein n=1 Tax=Desulfosarcina sp. TaxID=2027861 RepID=UPI003565CB3E